MAGDWIKVETCTPDKPEVYQISEILGIDPDAVIGKLFRIWVWADQQTIDGNACGVTKALLDRVTGVSGFTEAMEQVGWLTKTEGGFQLPNFDRHNGHTAKKRSQTAKRVQKHRDPESKPCNAKRNARSVTKTLPEKNREKKNTVSISEADAKSEVVIPDKINTPEAILAARMWFSHLEVTSPEKVPMSGSPQEEAFWLDAARMGSDRFVRSVEHCVARGWINLRQFDETETKGKTSGTFKRGNKAADREAANADAFAVLYAAIGDQESHEAG